MMCELGKQTKEQTFLASRRQGTISLAPHTVMLNAVCFFGCMIVICEVFAHPLKPLKA